MSFEFSPGSWFAHLGARALAFGATVRQNFGLLGAVYQSLLAPGHSAARVCRSVLLRQIFYTSYQALGLISLVAFLIGATLILQTELLASLLPRELAGRVLAAVLVREVAPLVTAILVTGRSGTAIATELGVMRVNAEILSLSSLGIDPARFLVAPRILATLISLPLLTIYFSAIALTSGLFMAFFLDSYSVGDWQTGLFTGLQLSDLPFFLLKTLGLGALVGWLCCAYGLTVQTSPTEVPQKASLAVVRTLLACIAYNAAITALYYSFAGGSLL